MNLQSVVWPFVQGLEEMPKSFIGRISQQHRCATSYPEQLRLILLHPIGFIHGSSDFIPRHHQNPEGFLNAIKTAKAPERVTNRFLANLEFASSNDRLLIGLLKALGFTDDSGVPTKRYFEFLDQSRSAAVLADAIREAYSDLFAINTKVTN